VSDGFWRNNRIDEMDTTKVPTEEGELEFVEINRNRLIKSRAQMAPGMEAAERVVSRDEVAARLSQDAPVQTSGEPFTGLEISGEFNQLQRGRFGKLVLHATGVHSIEIDCHHTSIAPGLFENMGFLYRQMPSRVEPCVMGAALAERVTDRIPFLVAERRRRYEMPTKAPDE
jgi:hypothetical protein